MAVLELARASSFERASALRRLQADAVFSVFGTLSLLEPLRAVSR